MVPMGRWAPNPLIKAVGRPGSKPKYAADVNIVEDPQGHAVSEFGVDIGRVEQTGAAIIQWHSELAIGFTSQTRQKYRIQISLSCLSAHGIRRKCCSGTLGAK